MALMRAMADDDSVLVLGQDVGVNGGVFRATEGLYDLYGADRVIDTPLAELGTTGVSIGLAAQGFRPIVEIQFMGFIYSAIDQLANHASRLRSRTRGRLTCPMVLRAPFGGGIHAPEHHSESAEAVFTNIPGLRIVIPSSPARAYGLLLAAIRDPDPVVFLEPKRLYRAFREPVEDNGTPIQLDRCTVLREGTDLTIVTWGAMTLEALAVAETLAGEGIDVEAIDVTTLKPLDSKTIIDSVSKTGRCIIVHEAPLTGGYGAEVAAQIVQHGLLSLLAPVKRVAGYDTVMPLPKLESHYMPNEERILTAAREVLDYQ
jgi:pyruvate dehydrogenase E1 component beta subunit